jgi:hypothetical protein
MFIAVCIVQVMGKAMMRLGLTGDASSFTARASAMGLGWNISRLDAEGKFA